MTQAIWDSKRPYKMQTRELRVSDSCGSDYMEPSSGYRLRILGFYAGAITITSALTATKRATLSFGTSHYLDPSKILWSNRYDKAENSSGVFLGPIDVSGDINEKLTLTNATYTPGACIMRAIIYFVEEKAN